jgi:hypothetical protein
MSCGIALALVLSSASPEAAMLAQASAIPASLASEPLYADIVRRAKGLNTRVKIYQSGNGGGDFADFKREVEALAALDMQAHLDLKARNVDGDLKCILKGIAEDLPLRMSEVEAAKTVEQRALALKEMSYLLNDNVEVVQAPPGPATPPPAA